jgi:hypothetical protein
VDTNSLRSEKKGEGRPLEKSEKVIQIFISKAFLQLYKINNKTRIYLLELYRD